MNNQNTKTDKNDKIWFVFDGQTVLGPFALNEIHSGIKQNKIYLTDLVWSRQLKEWVQISTWYELQKLQKYDEQDLWYYTENGLHHGPIAHPELIKKLSHGHMRAKDMVWSQGMDRWYLVYEIPELMQASGLGLRKHQRVPLVGTVQITDSELTLSTFNISQGGVGLKLTTSSEESKEPGWDEVTQTDITNFGDDDEVTQVYFENEEVSALRFQVGQTLALQIQSSLLSRPVEIKGRIVYRHGDEIGLEFVDVDHEDMVTMTEYIQQFGV